MFDASRRMRTSEHSTLVGTHFCQVTRTFIASSRCCASCLLAPLFSSSPTLCFSRVCISSFGGFLFCFFSFDFSAPWKTVAAFESSTMRASLRPSDPAVSPAIERVNAELFTLTYGAIVRQLLTDYEEIEEVNKQLDTMGYNIGARLIDDFLAKANITKCTDFRETADVIAKVGFKMFLNVTATVANWSADNMECSLILEDNPLVDFVELPETCQGLSYCNILCGVLRGALEMVSMRTEVKFVKDMLRGDDVFEIRLKLLEQMPEEYPYKNDE